MSLKDLTQALLAGVEEEEQHRKREREEQLKREKALQQWNMRVIRQREAQKHWEEAQQQRIRRITRQQIEEERYIRQQKERAETAFKRYADRYITFEKNLYTQEINTKSIFIDHPDLEKIFISFAKRRDVEVETVDDVYEHPRKQEQERILLQLYKELEENPFQTEIEHRIKLVFKNPRLHDIWGQIPDVDATLKKKKQQKTRRDAQELSVKLFTNAVAEKITQPFYKTSQAIRAAHQKIIDNQKQNQGSLEKLEAIRQARINRTRNEILEALNIPGIAAPIRDGEAKKRDSTRSQPRV